MIKNLIFNCCLLIVSNIHAEILYLDNFDKDGLANNKGVGGGVAVNAVRSTNWIDSGNVEFTSKGGGSNQDSLLFSKNKFLSDTGFTLTARCFVDDLKKGEFSLGLISSDTNLSTYKGANPFGGENSVYALGLNLTSSNRGTSQGINFSNGSAAKVLDKSGTRTQFVAGKPLLISLEVEKGGYWCYRINGVYEASGVLAEGIDLSKSYHIAVFSKGASQGRKLIDFIKLEKGYASGERAQKSRGTWSGGMGLDKIQDLRTLDTVQIRLTDGAVLSASHWAPHKLLEKLAGGDKDAKGNPINLCVPTWGDLSKDEPENDPVLAKILAIKAAGFKVKAYANCQNFNGSNSKEYEVIAKRWMEYCDTNPHVVAFVKSQPFHTGIWNKKKQRYEDATKKFPKRKYMFCYAELVLKDYALRYGKYIDAWIFDSGGDINSAGDNIKSGVLEEQRIYQAFAKAVHAGNPHIAIAFNNGRSTVKSPSFPYQQPTHYDDFTFGHAAGGNHSHGVKGGTFDRNYLFVKKMTAKNGYVFTGAGPEWDDKIVGNFHSKLSTSGWKSGGKPAWEKEDFLKWNLEAMRAGGIMTWDGSAVSKKQRNWVLRPWSYELLKALDDHLAVHQFPGTPNWARAYTVLPEATVGKPYLTALTVGSDLWDPEGDKIVSITKSKDAPGWLKITRDPNNQKKWNLTGTPSKTYQKSLNFTLKATDSTGKSGTRDVVIQMEGGSKN